MDDQPDADKQDPSSEIELKLSPRTTKALRLGAQVTLGDAARKVGLTQRGLVAKIAPGTLLPKPLAMPAVEAMQRQAARSQEISSHIAQQMAELEAERQAAEDAQDAREQARLDRELESLELWRQILDSQRMMSDQQALLVAAADEQRREGRTAMRINKTTLVLAALSTVAGVVSAWVALAQR